MARARETIAKFNGKFPLKIAIVGGGRACKFFLDLLRGETFSNLKVKIVGVCDINPEAEGLKAAEAMGIYTTDRYKDFFEIRDLDGILELTNSNEVLLDLINLRPRRIGILEHNIGRLLRNFFIIDQRLKSAEYQVVSEKMISEFLIQQAKQRIIVLNTDFTIASINDAYLKAIDRPESEILGAHCYQILHDLKVPCSGSVNGIECPMVETLRTGESAHVIHEDPVPGAQPTYMDIVTYPVKDETGKILRVIEIWRDITEELTTRWEKRVEKLKANLNKMVQEDRLISLGKLVASCVHEINNPIQGLLTFSRLTEITLAEGPPGPDTLKKLDAYASLMTRELERCGEIVSGLLSFSRESSVEHARLDMNEVLDSVIRLIRHKLDLQDIELHTDMNPSPLMVLGDMNQLQQCFLNLIFNAIEAMRPGGRLDLISRTTRDDENILVIIRDNGYGIAEDCLDHIYDPFFTTKEIGEGTGLGLSIVYGVVKNHSGNITVESKVGKGTSFALEFPFCPATEERDG